MTDTETYIPVKDQKQLEEHKVFIPKSTLYKWSHYNTYPGLFRKIPHCRDLFLALSKYHELFQQN